MTRTPIAELQAGDARLTVWAECVGPSIRTKKDGSAYFAVTLRDTTGSIDVRVWKPTKLPDGTYSEEAEMKHGTMVSCVPAEIKDWQGTLQISGISEITVVEPGDSNYTDVKEAVSTAPTEKELDRYFGLMKKMLSDISHPALRKMCLAFLEERADDIRTYPGAPHADGHHGYAGGYLIHVTNVMRLARYHAQKVLEGEFVSPDVVVAGAFFHDIGKFDTYVKHGLARTREGRMVGHILLGAPVLMGLCEKFEIDKETATMVLHILTSHHGKREFGSPETPQTIEAEIVCWADMADSKAEAVKMKLKAGLTPAEWRGTAHYGRHTAYVQPEFEEE